MIRSLQQEAVIAVSGPDVRWCGNEAGNCRESEWSVVPAEVFSQSEIAKNSQQTDDKAFREKKLDQMTLDLGSREVVRDAKHLIWYPSEVDVSIRPGWFYHESEDLMVKSLEELKRIYLNAVGGNSVLLLNIPPHMDGFLTDYDVERLSELGNFIRTTFENSDIQDAALSASSTEGAYKVENIVKDDETYWKAEDYCDESSITVEYPNYKKVEYIVLQEQIRLSQRVEEFEVWSEDEGGESIMLYRGTTIGYKKICQISQINVKKIQIRFIACRKSPTIKYLGIY